ncbi:hypothetical protein JYQ62_01485 [Nostoc sp. UHCC 0702]|nr:hypothetical protein JYQ62_01485 [Nostoc sp. UHCC 0702]
MNAQKEIVNNATIEPMVIKEPSHPEKLEGAASTDAYRIKIGATDINLQSEVPEFTKNYLKIVVERGEDVKDITKKLRDLGIKYSINTEQEPISSY